MVGQMFNRENIDKYLLMAKKEYPDIDINLLEYVVSSYLLYDCEGVEKPNDETNEQFLKAQAAISSLIEQTAKINKELSG